ncbi:hypothetical protein LIA77_06201 [Sarocladium implicatum]|nr:hypothetical protein LIA77_06201 [Sarocladium implicatum]
MLDLGLATYPVRLLTPVLERPDTRQIDRTGALKFTRVKNVNCHSWCRRVDSESALVSHWRTGRCIAMRLDSPREDTVQTLLAMFQHDSFSIPIDPASQAYFAYQAYFTGHRAVHCISLCTPSAQACRIQGIR